jgi:hemerythrin-like domain-containing protein
LRQNVDNIIRDFINHERQHMAMEERVVFPAALNALRPEDWADIALKLADRYDPFYQPGFEEKFNKLRRNILEMEEEAEDIAKQFGVDPGTVQRISRPFAAASVAAVP